MGKYIVFWVNEETEAQGYGSPVSKAVADAAVIAGNKEYPHIRHEMKLAKTKKG